MMKHTEYGLRFVRGMEGKEEYRTIFPLKDSSPLSEFMIGLDYSGYLSSIDDLFINPLSDLIANVVTELEDFEDEHQVTVVFTKENVFLKEGSEILQAIPSVDFKMIMEEWRDFMNATADNDWRNREPFKWFRFF